MSISRNNSIWFKFLAVLLVVALLFTFVFPRPQAKAIALVDDAVLVAGAAVAVMIAAGIYFTSQNTDADTFGSFISGKIDSFISSEGSGSVSEYASGISLNPNGVGLNVSDPTMRFLDRFLNWFKGEENLSSDSKIIFPLFSSTWKSFSLPASFRLQSAYCHVFASGDLVYVRYTSSSTGTVYQEVLTSYSSAGYNRFQYCNNVINYWFTNVSGGYNWSPRFRDSDIVSESTPYLDVSASYTANPAYSVSDTHSGTLPFIIVIDETAAGGSGGNNNKHDTARDAAISALQLGLAGKLLSSVSQSSSDTGEEGGDTNVSADVSGIRAAVNSIKNWLDTGFKTFSEVCTQFFTDVRLFFADFWTNFTTKLKEVFKTSLETIQDLLGNIKTGISSAAESIKTAVSTAADTIGGKIDSIGTKISDWWEEWRSSKNDKPTSFFGSGFNSIWHYVVEWLSYIGGFLSLVLNVWSVLPYGMVVPVYASVVLILYFGIYRKFIK